MVNIVHACIRKDGSALDRDLTVLALQPILPEILAPHPTISKIFLTSASGANSCLGLLKRHLKVHNIALQPSADAGKSRLERLENPIWDSFEFDGRTVSVYSLYSPSPTAMRAGITEQDLYTQYNIIAG